jgi:outer membrane protein assembly factor BamB
MRHKIVFLVALILLIMVPLALYRAVTVSHLIRSEAYFPLKLKWQVDLGRSAYDRPAYQDGLVISTANGLIFSKWYAINANTGNLIWTRLISRGNFRRCLTPQNLVLSGPWSLIVLQTQTGATIWEQTRPPAYTATCSTDTIFSTGVPRDSILAYAIASGQQLWSGTEPMKSFHGLVYNPETEEIIAKDIIEPGDFYIVDAQTGVLLGSFEKQADPPTEVNSDHGPILLVDQNELFIGGTVQNAQTGQVIHKEDQYKTVVPPTVTTDTMYLSAFFKGIVAFDRTDYSIKWVYQPQPSDPLTPLAPIVNLDRTGYVIFSDATLRAFDLETGDELGYWQPEASDLWWWPMCSFPPFLCDESAKAGLAVSDDTLFVSFGDGKLYAFSK